MLKHAANPSPLPPRARQASGRRLARRGPYPDVGYRVGMYLLLALVAGMLLAAVSYTRRLGGSIYPLLGDAIVLFQLACPLIAAALALRYRRTMPLEKRRPLGKTAYFGLLGLGLCVGAALRVLVIVNRPTVLSGAEELRLMLSRLQLSGGNALSAEETASCASYLARTPSAMGYPLSLLKYVFEIFGVSAPAAMAANLVCDLGAAVLCAAIARRLCGGRSGTIALWIYCVWPSRVVAVAQVDGASFVGLQVLLCLWLLCALCQRGGLSLHERKPGLGVLMLCVLGVVAGRLPFMTDTGPLLMVFMLVAMVWLPGRARRAERYGAAAMVLNNRLLSCLIVLGVSVVSYFLAWANAYYLLGERMPIGLGALGFQWMTGANVAAGGAWNAADSAFFLDACERASAPEALALCWREGFARYQAMPLGELLNLLLLKVRTAWEGDSSVFWNYLGQMPDNLYVLQWPYLLLVAGSGWGALRLARRRLNGFAPLAGFLYCALACVLLTDANSNANALFLSGLPPLCCLALTNRDTLKWLEQRELSEAPKPVRLTSDMRLTDDQALSYLREKHLRVSVTPATLHLDETSTARRVVGYAEEGLIRVTRPEQAGLRHRRQAENLQEGGRADG